MKAWNFHAVYYDGECYCIFCLPKHIYATHADEVHPIFASDEADSYPVCTVCSTIHDYIGLIDYGKE